MPSSSLGFSSAATQQLASVPSFNMTDAQLVEEVTLYKQTAASELVVIRKLRLCQDRFITYHDHERDPDNKRSWYLDRKCDLSPRSAGEIKEAVRKTVRPRGTWTITATVMGSSNLRDVHLYMFTVSWPTSWAAKGYTSFTFGFENLEEARHWHTLFQGSINWLKERSLVRRGKASHAGNVQSMVSSPVAKDALSQLPAAAVPADSSPSSVSLDKASEGGSPFGSAAGAAAATTAVGQRPSADPPRTTVSGLRDDAASTTTAADDPAQFYDADEQLAPTSNNKLLQDLDADSDDEEEASHKARRRARHALNERWVPYKQTNGVAVYFHNQSDDSTGVGGEYMVSAVVRGRPTDVLDVLMHGSANTTILGPATKVEVLECSRQEDDTTKEVLRIQIEAPGWTGAICAPREMIVERVLKLDDSGLYCVLFTSVDPPNSHGACATCMTRHTSSVVEDMGGTVVKTQESRGPARRGLFRQPVLAKVRGGYTIAPLEEYKLETSPETLITCIIKAELNGVCGERSWFRPVSDILGWREAFLDRILMSVILVRDEVEHGRFVMPPFTIIGPQGQEAAGLQAAYGSMSGAGGAALDTQGTATAAAQSKIGSRLHADGFTAQQQQQPLSPVAEAPSFFKSASLAIRPRSMSASNAPNMAAAALAAAAAASSVPEEDEGADADGAPAPNTEPFDLAKMRSMATLETRFWTEIHAPGTDAPFVVRGPTYLKDRKKIPAGITQFVFASMDVIELPHPVEHVARFLPAIRQSGMPWGIVINLIIPGTPLLGIVATFMTEHPPEILGDPPKHPMEEEHDWQPFDFALHKFVNGTDEVRNRMLKLIPHIADGSWFMKQSVGTTPVITGKALKTTYHVTKQYMEIDIDVSANNVAAYVTGLVRGATKSLVIDMGFVLEGTAPWELPEALLGALRLNYLDLKFAKKIDVSREIPLRPPAPPMDDVPADTATGPPSASGLPPNGGGEPSVRAGGASAYGGGSLPTSGSLPAGMSTPSQTASTFGVRHRHTRTPSVVMESLGGSQGGANGNGNGNNSPTVHSTSGAAPAAAAGAALEAAAAAAGAPRSSASHALFAAAASNGRDKNA